MIGQYDFLPTVLDYAGFGNVPIANTPGRSYARHIRGEAPANWGEDVFFEQEESRGIRTRKFAYWKRMPGFGSPHCSTSKRIRSRTTMCTAAGLQRCRARTRSESDGVLGEIRESRVRPVESGKTKSFTGRTSSWTR